MVCNVALLLAWKLDFLTNVCLMKLTQKVKKKKDSRMREGMFLWCGDYGGDSRVLTRSWLKGRGWREAEE